MSELQQSPETGETSPELRVEVLGYIGGEYGFCEALTIGEGSTQQFLLYNPQIRYDWHTGQDTVKHWVSRFPTREDLESAYATTVSRLSTDPSLPWEQVDETLDAGVSKEALSAALSEYGKKR